MKPETQWNTELILELCNIEQAALEQGGETKKLSILYHIESDDIFIPVNIGNQAASDIITDNSIVITLVKMLKDNGHVHLVTDVLDSQGVNILPTYLNQLDRNMYVSFLKDQVRVDVRQNSHLISVFDVKHNMSSHLCNEISFWDAVARHVSLEYSSDDWRTKVHRHYMIKQNNAR